MEFTCSIRGMLPDPVFDSINPSTITGLQDNKDSKDTKARMSLVAKTKHPIIFKQVGRDTL
jgi:hypothetical protein